MGREKTPKTSVTARTGSAVALGAICSHTEWEFPASARTVLPSPAATLTLKITP